MDNDNKSGVRLAQSTIRSVDVLLSTCLLK